MAKSPNSSDDPNKGVYVQKAPIRVERIFRSTVQKEFDTQRSRTEAYGPQIFQMNLANRSSSGGFMRIKYSHNRAENITEAPGCQSPEARRSLKGMDPKSQEIMTVKHIAKRPTDKWDLPQTTSHDPGWLQARPVRASDLRLASPSNLGGSRQMSPLDAVKDPWLRDTQSQPNLAATVAVITPVNKEILARSLSQPELFKSQTKDSVDMNLGELNEGRWQRPRHTCDVSEFAEIYRALVHSNPFAKAPPDTLYAALPLSMRSRRAWKA
jgi:hypothetical protein